METPRWKQRYQRYQQALARLQEASERASLDDLARAGLIQYFEFSFELAWKTLKDYLAFQGVENIAGPRAVLKEAFQQGLISEGHIWIQALEDRNLSSHTYEEETAVEIEKSIREVYLPLLTQLADAFRHRD